MMPLEIGSHHLSLKDLISITENGGEVKISESALSSIQKCRDYLEQKLSSSNALYYGINTGFGALCNVAIDQNDMEDLQTNLIISHACGTGEEIPTDLSRLIILLKLKNFCFGHSGISLDLMNHLLALYNLEITPIVYELGSLGASGDLVPLAHMSLALLGKGNVYFKGQKIEASAALAQNNLQPIHLKSKEGLALINGTQFSTAYATWILMQMEDLFPKISMVAALSLDAFNCHLDPFDAIIQEIRNHPGQIEVSKQIRTFLEGSEVLKINKKNVQDPYSFRCIPQVHGASYDTFQYAKQVVENEINAVTDNPLIFPDTDQIISGGNFHAQPIALVLDLIAIALAELASISERRIYKLLNGERGLPPFLIDHPGINSGLMICQYTAAAIVSQNKQLCTPASVDSITSSAGQEDHVSMAANAGTKAYRVYKNLERLIALELFVATQAFSFRKGRKSGAILNEILADYRKQVSFVEYDRMYKDDIDKSFDFIKNLKV